jgi:uncharacterized membrane protein
VDSELYDQNRVEELKKEVRYDKLGFLADKGGVKPDGFDLVLEKPFLPTDFVNLMDENFKILDPSQIPEDEIIVESEELDLDALDKDEEIALDDVSELDLDSLEELEESSEEDIAKMVDEIEEMQITKESEEISKDDLSDIDSIVDEELVRESLDEVEAKDDDSTVNTLTTGIAAAAAATAVSVVDQKEIDVLNGVEAAIESEEDYIEDSKDKKIDDLTKEFDSLNEDEVRKIMSNEPIQEESEVKDINLKGVEIDNLEDIVAKALSKALTKEMIQEALNEMELSITLRVKK